MDHLLSVGKKFFKSKSNNNNENEGSEGGFNPLPMFKQLDRNGDGKITEEDFVMVIQQIGLGSIGDGLVRTVFKQIDKNHNGTLEFSEALAAFETIKKMFFQKQKESS